jgi:hypothetical protein
MAISPPLRAIAAVVAATQGNIASPAAGRHHISIWGRGKGGALVRHVGQTIWPGKVARRCFDRASAGIYLRVGTAAAAGTVATFMVGADEMAPAPYTLGKGIQLTKGNALGLKVKAGDGTVAGYFTGDYVY